MCFGALTFPRCVHDPAPQTGSCCSLLTAACKYTRGKKLQEKQNKLNSLPPILRPKNKKSRELAAVAHFQLKIRPRRFVDTDKLNRKEWVRTEVALNPFLHEQTSDRELHFGQGVWNGAQDEGRGDGDAVATSSGLQKPKKVWAKKKFVDTKANKAKKRASSKFK